ncbi:MAG: hypothetical protein AAB570_01190 [Patescibacteria group bacterium]
MPDIFPGVPPNIIERFVNVVRFTVHGTVLPLATSKDATDTGCCVTLWMRIHDPDPRWTLVCVIPVGVLTPEQYLKYCYFSAEKGHRLTTHADHIVSYQSRSDESDPDWTRRQYPGAVRMDLAEVIVSTSGFAWELDELASILIGSSFGWVSRERCEEALAISRNRDAEAALRAANII